MNPYKLRDVFKYLTSNNQLLKKKLKLGTSEIPIPPKRQDVIDVEVVNRFTKANPRVNTTNLKPLSVKQSKEPDMKADGGRIGYKDGPKLTDFLDVQASGSKTGKNQITGAPKGITIDSESINAIIKADIPISQKIDLIAEYKYGKGRNRIENKDQEIFLDEGGYKDRNVGLDFNRDGEGFSGSVNYGIDTGEPEFKIKYKKSFADGGMLVQPSDDGSRPGYKKDKFTVGSGPGTGDALSSDRNTKIVKSALNKIKKQVNNKPYFEWSEKSDWYKKLRTQLGGNAEGVGMNRDFTNQLINKVVNENFPGSYHGKNAIKNLRQDMVVNGFVEYLKDNGEFDGGEKFLKSLEKFEGVGDHRYQNINSSWKSWIAGEFEVEGVDRTKLAKELETRGIDYSKIDDWSANASQKRGINKKTAIEFLDKQNNKFPNRSFEDVEKLYKQKFPDRNIYLDVNTLTDIKRTGIYKSGDSTTSKYNSVSKGNRANWLKESYGKQFQGNYSKLIQAADQLEAAGEFKKAKRISDAADKFFGPNGLITKAKGQGEHALARTFDLLNPERQLAINSLVSGDLNQFKKNFFDVPVKRFFDEYNNPNTTAARRKELKTLIEDRKKTMNSLTGGQKKGIVAGDIVRFQYTPDKIVATSNVEALDTKFKKGEFNIQEYLDRGSSYDEAFKTIGSQADIFTKTGDIKSTYSKPINAKKANILSAFCGRKGFKSAGSVDGLTCSMEEIQTNMQKQIDQAAKASKNGRIPPKFGKLTAFAKMFFGDVAIPLEYMFAAPYLAAGDIEGAKRASTAGLLGYGKVDLDKLPEGEGQRFLKHINALNSYMDNYQTKAMAESELGNSNNPYEYMIKDKMIQAQKNMNNIASEYQFYGYDGQKGLLQGKVAAQQLIRDQVQSDYNKKINKATNTEFFKDSDKELLESNIRYEDKENDPNQVTPINDLESYIKNKGEAAAGNTNLLFNVKPYVLNRAEAYGVPDIFDQYAGGYAGVETPGFIRGTGEVDMGTKSVMDAYSSLPTEYASQLAALEKKQFEEGMLKKDIEQRLTASGALRLASGGIASLTDTIPPESGPTPQGLPYVYNNVKKI